MTSNHEAPGVDPDEVLEEADRIQEPEYMIAFYDDVREALRAAVQRYEKAEERVGRFKSLLLGMVDCGEGMRVHVEKNPNECWTGNREGWVRCVDAAKALLDEIDKEGEG